MTSFRQMKFDHQEVIDQLGSKVKCVQSPQRIVSLVPSQTELLFDLGLEDRVVGVTTFCTRPKDKNSKCVKIGGTKKFNIKKINTLTPDLIIGNKEENYKEGIEELKKYYPVWMSDITTLDDSLDMIRKVGILTGTVPKANALAEDISKGLNRVKCMSRKKALYIIWKNPYMAAGRETFINEMLPYAGFDNIISEVRYPELTDEQIQKYAPEYILLSTEPYPFRQEHIATFQRLCPNATVLLVDGEVFSWYGSRLKYAIEYFDSFQKLLVNKSQ